MESVMGTMLTPGVDSTEYKIAKWMGIGGTILLTLSMTLEGIFPDMKIISIIGAIAGSLIAIAGPLGYQIPRANLKMADMKAQVAQIGLQAGVVPVVPPSASNQDTVQKMTETVEKKP
jgi:hypothetical protein